MSLVPRRVVKAAAVLARLARLARAVRMSGALTCGALAVAGCGSSKEAAHDVAPAVSTEAAGVARTGVWGTPAALESLRAGGVAVLGAVMVNEVDQVRPPLIAALDSVLAARWPGVPVRRYARVRSALDDSTARFLLLGYQLHGQAEPLWLSRAGASLRDSVRYGVLARVRRTRVRTVERDSDRADESGKPIRVRATIVEGDVALHLYDLVTNGLLYSRTVAGEAERDAPSDSLLKPERPPLQTWSTPESRAAEPMQPQITLFPEPPSPARAVAGAMAAFADSVIGGRRP